MQRINENTYIDDTLVTCAEYQLFLDEMREQGKYYRPDHWTSYQFPAGTAREPILGVRHSDAVAFCEWLTQQKGGEWIYRLPSQEEAVGFSLNFLEKRPLGYWSNGELQFIWVGVVPKDVRGINRALAWARAHDINRDQDLDLERDRDRALDIDRDINCDIERFDITNLSFALTHIRELSHDKIYQYLDPTQACKLARKSAHTSTRDHALDFYIDILTLDERIAGRSPAFEGIRLVKERIR